LSFLKYFKHVVAIELSNERSKYLKNNIDIYEFNNYTIINNSSINYTNEQLEYENQDIIFIDPPWGGINYKNTENIHLTLSEKSIEELLFDIIDKLQKYNLSNNLNNNYKIIAYKLPKNYDIKYFYNFVKKNNPNNYNIKLKLYILNKMLLLICECVL
jgi:16S rRNA G966 N2-methylase RsmD